MHYLHSTRLPRQGLLVSMLCALLLAPLVFAQEQHTRPRRVEVEEIEGAAIRVNTELVSVDVLVSDRTGQKNAPRLAAEEFVVYEDGKRQEVANFSAAEVPFSLVLLLDVSGSASRDLSLIRQAAIRFLQELRPQDRVAIVTFHKDVEQLINLTDDRKELENALTLLPSGTGSAVYDGLETAITQTLGKIEGRKAVISLTDGVDSYGAATYEKLLPLIERSSAMLYFLEVDTQGFTETGMARECTDRDHFEFSEKQLKKYFIPLGKKGPLYERHCILDQQERRLVNRALYAAAHQEMQTMAEKTGGLVYPVKSLEQLEPAFSRIAAELRTLYSLAYYPTNDKHDGTWRKLRVEVRRKGWAVRARPGYRAPKG
ncbi:MAG: VWA domain-containing protein [Blastocatellia bacterium]